MFKWTFVLKEHKLRLLTILNKSNFFDQNEEKEEPPCAENRAQTALMSGGMTPAEGFLP